jgi:hypothetical protein
MVGTRETFVYMDWQSIVYLCALATLSSVLFAALVFGVYEPVLLVVLSNRRALHPLAQGIHWTYSFL